MTRYWIEAPTWHRRSWALWSSDCGFLWAFRVRADADCAMRRLVAGAYLDHAGKIRPHTSALFEREKRKRTLLEKKQ